MLKWLLFSSAIIIYGCGHDSNRSAGNISQNPMHPDLKQITDSFKNVLKYHSLDPWYPASMDTLAGGFITHFSHDWTPDPNQPKMIVSQARLIWTASTAMEFFPNRKDLPESAEHGFRFLRDKMWDPGHGGFYNLVDREGNPLPDEREQIIKEAYGNAFAIYGLAAYAAATGNENALNLAIDTFHWLDEHAYDPEHGGYFNFLGQDGTPLTDGYQGTPPKDQNSSIHILEAFTELYHIWPDPHLGERLREMLHLIRDTIRIDPGYLVLFSEADWSPVSYRDSTDSVREENYYFDHVSFGHDVETAFLMIEASEALEIENDSTTHFYARQMVDHSLENGWDNELGGFYDGGYYFDPAKNLAVVRSTKNWWSQAEGLNALYLMDQLYPEAPQEYGRHYQQLWNYIEEYFLDKQYSGWYESGLDKTPGSQFENKGHIWKTNYHEARALMNGIRQSAKQH